MNNYFLDLHRGDVVIADLGNCDNNHLFGKRRGCILISNELCNKHSPVLSIVCLSSNTSEAKTKLPTRVLVTSQECGMSRDCTVACEQIISIDRNKIKRRVGSLNYSVMNKIDDAVRIQLAL